MQELDSYFHSFLLVFASKHPCWKEKCVRKVIQMFKSSVPQRRAGGSPLMVRNITELFKESGGISASPSWTLVISGPSGVTASRTNHSSIADKGSLCQTLQHIHKSNLCSVCRSEPASVRVFVLPLEETGLSYLCFRRRRTWLLSISVTLEKLISMSVRFQSDAAVANLVLVLGSGSRSSTENNQHYIVIKFK